MNTWSRVLQLDEPVVGNVEDYQLGKQQADQLCSAAEQVRDEFRKIKSVGLESLEGQTATEFRQLVDGVDECLYDLPAVLDSVGTVLGEHATALSALRTKAIEALARAKTHWNSVQREERASDEASEALRYLRSQLDSLEGYSSSTGNHEERSTELLSKITAQETRVSMCNRQLALAKDNLDRSRLEHSNLQKEEEDLVETTVKKLENIDLKSLANPGFLEKAWGFVKGAVSWTWDWVNIFDDIQKFVEAIKEHGLAGALHYLRDILDKLSSAIAVVGIVACVIGAFFTGGATLALIPAVLALSAGVEAFRLGITLGLTFFGTPHPETGQALTWTDFGVDLFRTALAAGGGGALAKTVAKPAGSVIGRAFGTSTGKTVAKFVASPGQHLTRRMSQSKVFGNSLKFRFGDQYKLYNANRPLRTNYINQSPKEFWTALNKYRSNWRMDGNARTRVSLDLFTEGRGTLTGGFIDQGIGQLGESLGMDPPFYLSAPSLQGLTSSGLSLFDDAPLYQLVER